MAWMVLLDIGLQACGWQPDSVQSWPGRDLADRYRVAGSLISGGSPATWVVRPWRMTSSPSAARTRNAWRKVPGFSPWSRERSGTDGRASPAASSPLAMASRSFSAACSHSVRRSDGSGRMSGTWRCSVNGLPAHARLPHFCRRAYRLSSSGPRTLRTSFDPSAGLMVRRM